MKNKCLRCGWVWYQRTEHKSKMCPRCKSYKWDDKKKVKE